MARTLPWLQGPSATKSKSSTTRAPKRQRLQDPETDSDASSTPAHSAKPKHNAATKPDRTPSTSPPPLPPSVEPMRPGLSQDDIYIMVEDEFLSTARLYTQHMHHAEYVRLKRLAATRKTAFDTGPIVRPVDSITKMREETKRRKEAEKHAKRVGDGLEKMMGTGKEGTGTESEADAEWEEDKMDAPGIGTVLGSLMTTSPRKGIGGLGGLHGVKSSTRAAAGFAKMDSQSQSQRRPWTGFSKPIGDGMRVKEKAEELEDETSDDDDDLDKPVRRSKTPVTRQIAEDSDLKTSITRPQSLKPPSAPRATDGHRTNRAAATAKQTVSDSSLARPKSPPKPPTLRPKPLKLPDDDFARPSSIQTDAIRRRMQARRERERAEERKKKEKPLDVDEIPIFLV